MNQGASTSSGITAEMLEEPQRQDSALHPLIEARRAVLQDLANNPGRSSAGMAISRSWFNLQTCCVVTIIVTVLVFVVCLTLFVAVAIAYTATTGMNDH